MSPIHVELNYEKKMNPTSNKYIDETLSMRMKFTNKQAIIKWKETIFTNRRTHTELLKIDLSNKQTNKQQIFEHKKYQWQICFVIRSYLRENTLIIYIFINEQSLNILLYEENGNATRKPNKSKCLNIF